MGVSNTVDRRPRGRERSIRGRARKPRIPGKVCSSSGQHPKEKDGTKRKENLHLWTQVSRPAAKPHLMVVQLLRTVWRGGNSEKEKH